MERLDFCSFVATLRRYIYADALGNQLDLLCLLFGSFLQSTDAEDFTFDNGQVCRWLNGTARVSPKITSFYLASENQEKLTQDMETKILTILSDPAMAAQSECDLLMQDVSISSSKKKSLYAERDFSVSAQVAEFLSLRRADEKAPENAFCLGAISKRNLSAWHYGNRNRQRRKRSCSCAGSSKHLPTTVW